METWEWITLAIVVGAALLLVLGLAAVAIKRRRRARLQDRFGSEYDRAVSEAGRRNAEQRLGDLDRELNSSTSVLCPSRRGSAFSKTGAMLRRVSSTIRGRHSLSGASGRTRTCRSRLPDRRRHRGAGRACRRRPPGGRRASTATATRSSSRSTAVRTRRTCGKR